jgi:hypothetical protein
VIVIVAVIGAVPVLIPPKDGTLPEPEAARPMVLLLFVHVKVVPLTALVRTITVEAAALLQIVCAAGVATAFGVGLTVIVAVTGVPVQPFVVGVTVIVATTGALVGLDAVKDVISPVPEADRPIEVVLLVQL